MDRGPELERRQLVTMICERARDLVSAETAVLWTVDDDGKPRHDQHCGDRATASGLAVERALVHLIARDGDQMINSAVAPMSPELVHLCDQLEREHSSAICVGLQRRDELLGVLCLHRIGKGPFLAREAADAERFAKFAALALHELTVREHAERDEVTGMPGRTLLLRALNERLAGKQPFGLACIDFDGLKAVNDKLGYEAGNELIRAVARAVQQLLHQGELVGRLHGRGGDEFVCLLDERDQDSLDSRCSVLEAALDRAEVPPELASSYLGVSVGAALAYGSSGPSPNGDGDGPTPAGPLFTAAENAMRERKRQRKRSQGRPVEGR
jgi:diguanylate cyclase (GGDEF)-like protein